MNKEILSIVDVVSHEKDIDQEVVFQAIETALAAATRKKHRGDIDVRVTIDRKTGDHKTFRRWRVVDDSQKSTLDNPWAEITLSAAREDNPDIQIGDYIEEPFPSIEFGRIAAQSAKQVLARKIREAKRNKLINAYRDKVNGLINGVVKSIEKGGFLLDLGNNAEAYIPKEEMIPREKKRVGERIRAYLYKIDPEFHRYQLFASRRRPELLIELFKLEVPEIADGLIEIVSAVRDPGRRAKIAVRTQDPRIDPIGSCVGMRGARVEAVSDELSDEKIDIILWDSNPAQFVINAMSPAEVISIIMDDEKHSMDIGVAENSLEKAIGFNGQNVRLANQLTGWELNIMTDQALKEKERQAIQPYVDQFMQKMGIDQALAVLLAQEGFTSIEQIAYIDEDELLSIEGLDEQTVVELRNQANDALLTQAIAQEETLTPDSDLLNMEGMDETLAYQLAAIGINTMEALAEQSIDELIEQIDDLDEKKAGQLIMSARAPWFEQDGK